MDAPAAHQHEIPRRQFIPFPLHRIASSAGQQNDDLVERMVVVFDIFPPPVRQMKQPKRLLQVSPRLILQWFHVLTSALFAVIIALAMQILQVSFSIITILKILFPFCNFCVAFLIDLCYDTSCQMSGEPIPRRLTVYAGSLTPADPMRTEGNIPCLENRSQR